MLVLTEESCAPELSYRLSSQSALSQLSLLLPASKCLKTVLTSHMLLSHVVMQGFHLNNILLTSIFSPQEGNKHREARK